MRKRPSASSIILPALLALANACGGTTAGGGGAGSPDASSSGSSTGSSSGSGSGSGGSSSGSNSSSSGSSSSGSDAGLDDGGCGEVHGGTPCPAAGVQCVDPCGVTCTCEGALLSWSCPDVATCGACPNAPPPPGTKCLGFTPGDSCPEPSGECICNKVADGTTEWQCFDCPQTKPTSGTSCSPVGLSCMAPSCTCYPDDTADGGIWSCNDPGTCPNSPPADNSACNDVGVHCPYLGTPSGCTCSIQHMWKCH
jgi:hypothetical protein